MNELLEDLLKRLTYKSNNYLPEKTPFIYKNNLIFNIYDIIERKRWVSKNKIIYRNCKFLKSVNRRAVANSNYINYCIFDNCTFDLTNTFEYDAGRSHTFATGII